MPHERQVRYQGRQQAWLSSEIETGLPYARFTGSCVLRAAAATNAQTAVPAHLLNSGRTGLQRVAKYLVHPELGRALFGSAPLVELCDEAVHAGDGLGGAGSHVIAEQALLRAVLPLRQQDAVQQALRPQQVFILRPAEGCQHVLVRFVLGLQADQG